MIVSSLPCGAWTRITGITACLLGIIGGAAVANANPITPGEFVGMMIKIEADSEMGSASWELGFDADSYDPETGGYYWHMTSPVMLMDGESQIGEIRELVLDYNVDPFVIVHFDVVAGGVDTNFKVTSTLVSFPGITDPSVFASCGVSLTDSAINGASYTGLYGANKSCQAFYNGGVAGTGAVFASLLNGFAIPFGTLTNSDSLGFNTLIGTTISDMSNEFFFRLSRNDIASGNGVMIVLPEPAAAALLMLAGVTLIRRRA